jgi:uncharacterized protein YdcH (DUF465 family)
MFPEYRDLISTLKATDRRVQHLLDKHSDLDLRIRHLEDGLEPVKTGEIGLLKKKKLLVKDEMYGLLRKVGQPVS